MSRNIFWWMFIIASALTGGLSAQVSPLASTAFPVLTLGQNARAVGMGESFTAVSDDLSAMQYNAAGLALLKGTELSLTHNSYLDSGFFDSAGAAFPLGPSGTLALGLNYLNYGSMDQRDALGNLEGSFTPFDLCARGAFGFALDKDAYLGLSSQWIRQDIQGVVHTGLLWDAGFLANLAAGFSMGAALQNLGVDSGGYSLPAQLWAGSSYRISMAKGDIHSLLLSLSGGVGFQGASRLNMGFEYALQKSYFLRGGYSRVLDESPSDGIKGLDFGAGIKISQFQFDYAFSFLGDLGNVHRFSLSIFLPNPPAAEKASSAAPAPSLEPALQDPSFLPPSYQPSSKPVLLKFQVASPGDKTAQEYFDQAEEKSRLGLKQEALDLYLKAVEKDQNFQMAWMSLGKIYFDRSLESYRKVLEMDPKNDKLREWLGHFKP